MANYTGQEYIPQPIRQDENFGLWTQVAAMQQQSYDKYKSQIQSAAASVLNTDLLREEDKDYLTSRYQEAAAKVNSYSNRNLTDPNVKRDIDIAMGSLAADPVIQNAAVNTLKFRNFQSQVQQIREKNKDAYSDINVQDALDQAGFTSYMNGQTNSLGELKYTNFTDVVGKLNKEAKDYAELLGKERLLDSENNKYYYKDVYGRKVTEDEIKSHLSNILTNEDKAQLGINARQGLGKASPQALDAQFSPYLKNKIASNKEQRAGIEARLNSTTDPLERNTYSSQIEAIDNNINDYQQQIDSKNYNIYGLYTDGLISSISSDFDVDSITGVKRDDMPFQLMKFETEQKWKQAEYDLKVAELQQKQDASRQASAPTAIEKPVESGGTLPSNEVVLRDNLKGSDERLSKYLRDNNVDNYNQKSPQEQWAYKVNLKADDPTSPNYSVEKQNLIRAFQTTQKGYAQVINDNTQQLISTAGEAYNSITGANLNNLKGELPVSVYYLQQGKKFEDLDKNVQKAVALELGTNWKLRGYSTSQENSLLGSSLYSLESQLLQHPSEKVRNLGKNIKANATAYSGDAYQVRSGNRFTGQGGEIYINPRALTLFSEDTDVTELERGQDARTDISSLFKDSVTSMRERTSKAAANLNQNLVSNKAFAFSTENKGQNPSALAIQSLIAATDTSKGVPNQTNNYVISRQGTGYNVQYETGSGNKKSVQTIYVDTLPNNLKQVFDTSEQDWNSDFLNPNLQLPQYTFTPKNKATSLAKLQTLSDTRPDIVPPETYVALHNSGSLRGTEYQSDEDFLTTAMSESTYNPSMLPAIQSVLNATYVPELSVKNGRLLGNINVNYQDGRKDNQLMVSEANYLDEGKLYIELLKQVAKYKQQQINNILGL